MKNKKVLIIIIVLLAAAIGAWLWFQSPNGDQAKKKVAEKLAPRIEVASLSVSDLDAERVKINAKILLDNPLPVAINASGLKFMIYIDSIMVIEDAYDKPISIEASDSSLIEIPMRVDTKKLGRLLKYFTANKIDSADYTIKSVLALNVPIAGEKDIKVTTTKRLPAYNFPTIKMQDVDFHALDLKGKGVDMVISFYNPNVFTIKLKNPTFKFAMEDAMEMEAVFQKAISVEPKQTENIAINAKLIEGKLLKSGWKLLTDKKDTQFLAKFKSTIDSEMSALKGGEFNVTVRGNIQELMDATSKK